MKRLLLTLVIILIYICSFGQTFQWGDNLMHDSLFIADSDTLNQFNFDPPNKAFKYVYGVNYGDIDSTTILIYLQASIPSYGWTTISDTITIDSLSTDRVFYLTGEDAAYPSYKFIIERDTIDETEDGWIRDMMYIKRIE